MITRLVQFEGRELLMQASIGIAIPPERGVDATTLLRNAEAARYQANEAGRNDFRLFQLQMNEAAQLRLAMEEALR